MKVDAVTLTCLLSVYSECRDQEALYYLQHTFPQYEAKPNALTYRSLIRMYIRRKEIAKALQIKESMLKSDNKTLKTHFQSFSQGNSHDIVIPCGYGMLIESQVHRGI